MHGLVYYIFVRSQGGLLVVYKYCKGILKGHVYLSSVFSSYPFILTLLLLASDLRNLEGEPEFEGWTSSQYILRLISRLAANATNF